MKDFSDRIADYARESKGDWKVCMVFHRYVAKSLNSKERDNRTFSNQNRYQV